MTSGFFYVGGHGIPSSLVDGTMDANRKLFSLPLEQKQALLADENNRGWTPFGEVRTPVIMTMADTHVFLASSHLACAD
ncbi:hypothetical protein DUNSADRAFT_4367 [Dunaliella salina]|uniref:Non-haem dioxygenase N-terminal domain-containing protein n=1 Tax=Dunaliella salina TaxID=3046 RepID=A0ABQ7GS58_DUNSA|nr:hypothetical protein DUNSADRAFT_4367 [Dunaliella salina]|eukprot:KAF5837451.1 hypothetical protein DUNSADRAFT_4367 [Dunaliella salina]